MKKLLSLVLALALMCGVMSAFAEDAGKTIVSFDENLSIGFAFPDDYAVTYDESESGIIIAVAGSEQEARPFIRLVIAQEDEDEDLPRLNDLSDEDKAEFIAALTEDMHAPECTIQETGFGTQVIVIRENETAQNYATLTTLYYGCIITMYMGYPDGRVVADEDIALGMQIFTDIDFIIAK